LCETIRNALQIVMNYWQSQGCSWFQMLLEAKAK